MRVVVETARKNMAARLHCLPSELYFTSGGTEADNTAIYGAVKRFGIKHIVSTQIEHHAVTHPIEHLAAEGVAVTYLGLDERGNISLDELREALATHPRSLVCLMHANNEIGTLLDIEAVGNICKEYDALFLCDTVQTVGHLPLDLSKTHVHYITGAAHKFYGPKGVGFLFVRKGFTIPSLVNGGSQERNLRAGTENVASIAGMAFALDKCCAKMEQKTAYMQDLKQYAMDQLLAHIPGIAFNGETAVGKSNPTVLNIALPVPEDDMLMSGMLIFKLDLEGISVSAGSACSSGATEGSHVLNSLGLPPSRTKNSIRMSFSPLNTQAEIDYCVEKLKQMVLKPVLA